METVQRELGAIAEEAVSGTLRVELGTAQVVSDPIPERFLTSQDAFAPVVLKSRWSRRSSESGHPLREVMRICGRDLLNEIGSKRGFPVSVDIVISRDNEQAFHRDVDMFEDALKPGCNPSVLVWFTRLRHRGRDADQPR